MVVIFGWGGGEAKDLGEIAPTTCPQCHNQVFLHHIRSHKEVSLYFVPLANYGSNEYLACPICLSGMQVAKEQRPSVDRMRAMTVRFRRGGVPADPSIESLTDELARSRVHPQLPRDEHELVECDRLRVRSTLERRRRPFGADDLLQRASLRVASASASQRDLNAGSLHALMPPSFAIE